jgi:hypothetical protein
VTWTETKGPLGTKAHMVSGLTSRPFKSSRVMGEIVPLLAFGQHVTEKVTCCVAKFEPVLAPRRTQ